MSVDTACYYLTKKRWESFGYAIKADQLNHPSTNSFNETVYSSLQVYKVNV